MTVTKHFGSKEAAAGTAKKDSPCPPAPTGKRPNLKTRRIGLVSRNYWEKLPRKNDFSGVLKRVLAFLDSDAQKCDTVMFSLWSIIRPFPVRHLLTEMALTYIKAVLYEEFDLKDNVTEENISKQESFPAKSTRFVVCHRTGGVWNEYTFKQVFGSLNPRKRDRREAKAAGWRIKDWMAEKANCLMSQIPGRTVGDCCVLLCGESNIVRYSRDDTEIKIRDQSHIKTVIPKSVRVILNPVHDRMSSKFMNPKRQFLSERPSRWVLSVWNKGKKKNGMQRFDGKGPAWTVFFNRTPVDIERLENPTGLKGLEVGVVDLDDRDRLKRKAHQT